MKTLLNQESTFGRILGFRALAATFILDCHACGHAKFTLAFEIPNPGKLQLDSAITFGAQGSVVYKGKRA